jgi:hypothetical protein
MEDVFNPKSVNFVVPMRPKTSHFKLIFDKFRPFLEMKTSPKALFGPTYTEPFSGKTAPFTVFLSYFLDFWLKVLHVYPWPNVNLFQKPNFELNNVPQFCGLSKRIHQNASNHFDGSFLETDYVGWRLFESCL